MKTFREILLSQKMKQSEFRSTRRQLISDPTVQGELLFRALIYWFFSLLVIILPTLAWSLWADPQPSLVLTVQQTLVRTAPAIFGAVILLPFVLLDVLRVSHRFVGPIRQVRHALKQLANGKQARRIYLRRADFWQDLANYTNIVAEDLEHNRDSQSGVETTSEQSESRLNAAEAVG